MIGWTRDLSPAKPGLTVTPGVVGASARAAVHSLARAGYQAWAVDQFCDRDLTRVAPCVRCDDYPTALPELAKQFPPGPVLYTGGLENHPHIVAELARTRDLWGNSPEALARMRDPHAQAACGFAGPRLVLSGECCPLEGRWLRKPLRSGGGLGIRFAQPGEAASPHHYFQEYIDGTPMSALFVNSSPIGVTEQLIGEPWLHASGFVYCGNIGPITVPPPVLPFPLLGPWGTDFVVHDGMPYVLEVNPRYTAGMEVLEHATGKPVFGVSTVRERVNTVGKAIYYTPHAFAFPRSGPWDADLAGEFDPWRMPGFADIPEAGSAIEVGHPVLTFFAQGSTPAEVRERLQSRAAELDLLFQEHQT